MNQQTTYYLDLVLCIDATISMSGIIDGVKSFCSGLHDQITEALDEEGKAVDRMRVKLIVFRDFAADGADALEVLDFMDPAVPEGSKKIVSFINGIEVKGGGDEPENGLEALALAFQSDWTREGTKGRHLIMLFTDAPPHPYGTVSGPAKPEGLPASEEEMLACWNAEQGSGCKLDANRRRMFLFAPTSDPTWMKWGTQMLSGILDIEQVIHDPDTVREQILSFIVKSVN